MQSRFSPGKHGCIVISRFPVSAGGGGGGKGVGISLGTTKGKAGGSDSHLYIIEGLIFVCNK